MSRPNPALNRNPPPPATPSAGQRVAWHSDRNAVHANPAATGHTTPADDVAVLLLADIAAGHRLWGWSRIVRGGAALSGVPGLRMAKALGSGHHGGFGLRPSASRQGLFAIFASAAAADDFIERSAVVRTYRQRAGEFLVAKLRATSSRGAWDGASMAVTATAAATATASATAIAHEATPPSGPVAALTRASIRPSKALQFWRQSPLSEAALAAAPGCRLAVGLGEAPVLRQATFSVWDNQAAMDAYARGGAHLDAIRGAQAGDWFSESMFVRFVPLLLQGRWQGRDHG